MIRQSEISYVIFCGSTGRQIYLWLIISYSSFFFKEVNAKQWVIRFASSNLFSSEWTVRHEGVHKRSIQRCMTVFMHEGIMYNDYYLWFPSTLFCFVRVERWRITFSCWLFQYVVSYFFWFYFFFTFLRSVFYNFIFFICSFNVS